MAAGLSILISVLSSGHGYDRRSLYTPRRANIAHGHAEKEDACLRYHINNLLKLQRRVSIDTIAAGIDYVALSSLVLVRVGSESSINGTRVSETSYRYDVIAAHAIMGYPLCSR